MWINRKKWDYLWDTVNGVEARTSELHAKNVELERHNASLTATREWLEHRLNQIELLNATLMQKIADVPISVPQVSHQPQRSMEELLNVASDIFQDPEEKDYVGPVE